MVKIPFDTWEIEEQTKMKHQVLQDYLNIWVKILGSYHKLNYIDGFGGIGAYKDASGKIHYGSPIIASKIAEENAKKLDREVKVIIIDEKRKCLENIERILKYKKIDISPTLILGDFNDAINRIFDKLGSIAPTFAFIDPFGFSPLHIKTIKRIMENNKSEVFLNFMYTRINQFFSASNVEDTYDRLFGNSDWKKIKLHRGFREDSIIEFYRKQLKNFSKFVYYYRFEFPDAERTYYYLFHLTNYFKGCAIMKSSFAKFNLGRVEYRGKRGEQLAFLDTDAFVLNEVLNYLVEMYGGKTKYFQDIIEENIDECEFLESSFRDGIRELEKQKKVEIERYPAFSEKGNARTAIDYTAKIKFVNKGSNKQGERRKNWIL